MPEVYSKVYYAHCMSIYGSPQEEVDLVVLQGLFDEVLNPNSEKHQGQYKTAGMGYFTDLVRQCTHLAFRANADGSIPAGVAQEIEAALSEKMAVIELPTAIARRTLSVPATREWLRQCGYR